MLNEIKRSALLLLLPVLFISNASVAYQVVKEHTAQISKNGHRIQFKKIPLDQLKSSELSTILRIRFKKEFKLTHWKIRRLFRISLNGAEARHPKFFSLLPLSRWERDRDGKWSMYLDLSDMRFLGRHSLAQWIEKIQRSGGLVDLKVRSPRAVLAAQLLIVKKNSCQPDKAPVVSFDSISPSGKTIASRSISFTFSADQGDARFECSMNGSQFAACQSPMVFNDLKNAQHQFRVRAISAKGKMGNTLTHSFEVKVIASVVTIQSVNPANSPTNSGSMRVQFAVSGTYQAAQCRLDGGAFVACTSPMNYSNLEDGAHAIVIAPAAGGQSASYAWAIDRTPPAVHFTQVPASLTRNMSASFAFESDEMASFACSLDDQAFSMCQSPLNLSGLSDGAHRLSIRATDAAGNQSEVESYLWNIDTEAPDVSIVGVSPQQAVSNIAELNISFAASESASFFCRLDGGGEAPCQSPLVLSNLSEGSHLLSIRARDMAGNEGPAIQYGWAIDLTPPNLTLHMVSPASLPTREDSASFEIVSSESGSLVCTLDGAQMPSCESSMFLSGLAEGIHRFEVMPIDMAGNNGQSASMEWEIDQTAPELSLESVVPSEASTIETDIQLNFQVSEAASFTCELDNGGMAPCASPVVYNGLGEGNHSIVVRARDLAGNQSEPLVYSWNIEPPIPPDVEAPIITLVSTSPNYTPTSFTSLTAVFTANEPTEFTCSLDGGPHLACSSPHQVSGLIGGFHVLAISGQDAAGNVAETVSHAWVVTTAALAISNVQVMQITQNSARISWTTNLGATGQVLYGVGNFGQASPVDSSYSTAHSIVLTGLQPFTLYQFQTRSVDRDGRSVNSSTFTFRTLR